MPSPYERLTEKVIASLEEGRDTGKWQMPWNKVSVAPHDPVSGVRYSGTNELGLIMDQAALGADGTGAWSTFLDAD